MQTPPLPRAQRRFPALEAAAAGGFSLIELLVVIAIVGLLTVFTVPAMQSISGAQEVARGAGEIGSLLELARSEAVARQTYVWVGVEQTNVSGTLEVRAAAVGSLDGSGTNTDEANLFLLTKVLRVPNASLARWEDLRTATRSLLGGDPPVSLAGNTDGVVFSSGATRFGSGCSVTFTPRGEALLRGPADLYEGFEPLSAVGLRQARGTLVSTEANDAAITIDGPTGAVQVLRVQ